MPQIADIVFWTEALRIRQKPKSYGHPSRETQDRSRQPGLFSQLTEKNIISKARDNVAGVLMVSELTQACLVNH